MNFDLYDAIMIGAGHNGLICAAYLAQAGRKVLVLEQRPIAGGIAAAEEAFSGFFFPISSPNIGMFHPEIVSDLDLDQHGLEIVQTQAIATSLLPDKELLTIWNDTSRTQNEITRFSAKDAERYPAYLESTLEFSRAISQLAAIAPPDLFSFNLSDILPWIRFALNIRFRGGRRMMELLHSLPLSAQEYLDEWFEDEALKGLLAFPSVSGTMQGPHAAGTALQLLYQHMGNGNSGYRSLRFSHGGINEFSNSLKSAAESFGAEVKCNASVSRILVENRTAIGIELASGEQFHSKLVVSSIDPRSTLFSLLPPASLEPRTMRRVRNIKFKGSTAKINLALSHLPEFIANHPEQERFQGCITISPSVEYLERAYDDSKYGQVSQSLAMEMHIPSLLDPHLAPDGKHILSIDVRYAPYRLRASTWEKEKGNLRKNAISQLAKHFSDINDCILHSQVISPLDYERDFSLSEGSLFHGQMGLDQLLFMRPIPGYANYRSPINNLYMCGSGSHPGGGVTGMPGYNAARKILKES